MGITEVLVAVGLMAIVSVGLMTMVSNANKSQRGIQAKDMQREVMAEIRTLLNNKTACLNSFGGGNPSAPFTRASIKDSASVDRFIIGANDKSNLLKYTEFKIEDWLADAGYTTQGSVSLTVALSKEGDVSGAREIKQKITLKIKRVAAGGITECFSIGSSSDGLWQVSPANPSNIYYSAGNVGVGTDTPASKLDVAGEVKFGNSASVCNAANEGQQRYNSITKNMEFCNGTAWAGFGRAITTVRSASSRPSEPYMYFTNITVMCLPDEIEVGGGGTCGCIGTTNCYLTHSTPYRNPSFYNGWFASCARDKGICPTCEVVAMAWVVCQKK